LRLSAQSFVRRHLNQRPAYLFLFCTSLIIGVSAEWLLFAQAGNSDATGTARHSGSGKSSRQTPSAGGDIIKTGMICREQLDDGTGDTFGINTMRMSQSRAG
jgi:hypothetical protein